MTMLRVSVMVISFSKYSLLVAHLVGVGVLEVLEHGGEPLPVCSAPRDGQHLIIPPSPALPPPQSPQEVQVEPPGDPGWAEGPSSWWWTGFPAFPGLLTIVLKDLNWIYK